MDTWLPGRMFEKEYIKGNADFWKSACHKTLLVPFRGSVLLPFMPRTADCASVFAKMLGSLGKKTGFNSWFDLQKFLLGFFWFECAIWYYSCEKWGIYIYTSVYCQHVKASTSKGLFFFHGEKGWFDFSFSCQLKWLFCAFCF